MQALVGGPLLNPAKYKVSAIYPPGSAAGGCDYDFSPAPCGRTWATADAIFVAGQAIYGLQGFPAAGGNVLNSLNIDLDNDTSSASVKTEIGDVELPCPEPQCLAVSSEVIDCVSTNGTYLYQFGITNQFPGPISYVTLLDPPPGVTFTPDIITLPTELQPGQGTCLSVMITGTNAQPGRLCFRIAIHTTDFVQCCVVEHCITLPDCCAYITKDSLTPIPNQAGCYNYTFTVQNLTTPPTPIQYLILVTDPPNTCYSISPDIIFLNPPLAYGQSITRTVTVCNLSQPPCHEPFCFQLSLHDTNFNACCSVRHCAPPQDPVVHPLAPADGSVFAPPATVPLAADVTPGLGISQVNFWANDVLVASASSPNFSGSWSNVASGTYSIVMEARTDAGSTPTGLGWVSEPVMILVTTKAPIAGGGGMTIAPAKLEAGKLSFTMQTAPGVTCHVEFTDSLSAPDWQILKTIVGDGSLVTFSDPIQSRTQRFYRISIDQ